MMVRQLPNKTLRPTNDETSTVFLELPEMVMLELSVYKDMAPPENRTIDLPKESYGSMLAEGRFQQ